MKNKDNEKKYICKFISNKTDEICTNAECPYCADFCPVYEHQEACHYFEKVYTYQEVYNRVIEDCFDTINVDSNSPLTKCDFKYVLTDWDEGDDITLVVRFDLLKDKYIELFHKKEFELQNIFLEKGRKDK